MRTIAWVMEPKSLQTIWVVDDSPTDAARTKGVLEAAGYCAEILHDGAEVLERLASGQPPSLLLLDWVMPGMSGIEVCEYIRSEKSPLPKVPILLLTANKDPKEILRAFRSGANDYVSKPFLEEELLTRVSATLNAERLLERAKNAENDFSLLLKNLPDPTFVVDRSGVVTFASDEGMRILNIDEAKVIGASLSDLIPEIDLRGLSDIVIHGISFSPSIRSGESRGRPETTISLRDVTERKLAAQVTERSRQQLEEERDIRERFVAALTHDLRTPMTATKMSAQLLFKKAGDADAVRAMSNRIVANVDRADRMIQDLLDTNRLKAGEGISIAVRACRLDEVIVSAVRELQEIYGPRVVVQNKSGEILGYWDGSYIQRIVENLVTNAVKYGSRTADIVVAIAKRESNIEISVHNEGEAIHPEDQVTLFNPHRRTSSALSSGKKGWGIGLALIKGIADAHRGAVSVGSDPKNGTTFFVELPLDARPATP